MEVQTRWSGLEGVSLQEHTVDHLGLKLHLRIWGDTTKPVVILQHGGKDHGRSWDFLVADLVRDYCCVVPDLRGHGDSAWVPGGGYEINDFVADFAVVLNAIKGMGLVGPYRVVGHSLGGIISLHYVAACPEDVLSYVNIEGLGHTDERYARWLEEPLVPKWTSVIKKRVSILTGTRKHHATLEEAASRLALVHEKLPEDMVAYLAKHGVRHDADGYVWKHDPVISYISLRPQAPQAYQQMHRAVKVPTTLFYGSDSFLGPFHADDERIARFDQVRYHLYEGAGHWLHHEELERFIADLREGLEVK